MDKENEKWGWSWEEESSISYDWKLLLKDKG